LQDLHNPATVSSLITRDNSVF